MTVVLNNSSVMLRERVSKHGRVLCLLLLPTGQGKHCVGARISYVTAELPKPLLRLGQSCASRLRATSGDKPGSNNSSTPGGDDDELDRLLGIGRYRDDSTGFFSNRNRADGGSSNGGFPEIGETGSSSEAGDILADVMQMEVRRVRAKEDLMLDLEDRKAKMRAIGEEMKEALAREYELDRMRTEIGANYAMSEAFQALDDVEAEVARIKAQLQADEAELAEWESQAAEDRSRGLFFKNLYAIEKEPLQPVGKSIPGFWRKKRAMAEAAAAAVAVEASGVAEVSSSSISPVLPFAAGEDGGDGGSGSGWKDTEAVAAAVQRPLSAASHQVRSPLRLYLFSYLSAFLALLVVNDVASSLPAEPPHVAQDTLYGMLSAGLGFVAVMEREALARAQEAMLDGIRRTYGSSKPPIQSQQQQEEQELK